MTTPSATTTPPELKQKQIKRSRRKSTEVFAVLYYYKYKYSGELVEIRDLKGLYYSYEVALHDLIIMLNEDFGAKIPYDPVDTILNEQNLELWMKNYEKVAQEMTKAKCRWTIEKIAADDNEKLLGKDFN